MLSCKERCDTWRFFIALRLHCSALLWFRVVLFCVFNVPHCCGFMLVLSLAFGSRFWLSLLGLVSLSLFPLGLSLLSSLGILVFAQRLQYVNSMVTSLR